MTNTSKRSLRNWNLQAIVRDLGSAWRLLRDPKVPGALKLLLPLAALLYVVSPIDLLPLNPIDDIAMIILALRMFVQWAESNSTGPATATHQARHQAPVDDDENTIETTWRVIDNKR